MSLIPKVTDLIFALLCEGGSLVNRFWAILSAGETRIDSHPKGKTLAGISVFNFTFAHNHTPAPVPLQAQIAPHAQIALKWGKKGRGVQFQIALSPIPSK